MLGFILIIIAIIFVVAISIPSKCPYCGHKNGISEEIPTGGLETDKVIECSNCKKIY